MRKIICDRCGAEITGDRIGYVAVNWRAVSDNSFLTESPYEHADFCEKCMKDFKSEWTSSTRGLGFDYPKFYSADGERRLEG